MSSGTVSRYCRELVARGELARLLGDLERRLKTTQLYMFIATVS